MSKQEIRIVMGQIIIIYEVIQEKMIPDALDLEMYRGLIRKFNAINAKLDEAMLPFDPLKKHLDVKTLNAYIFHEDSLMNMEHWTLDCKIREGQIDVLKQLIEKKRNSICWDSESTVELNKLSELGVSF